MDMVLEATEQMLLELKILALSIKASFTNDSCTCFFFNPYNRIGDSILFKNIGLEQIEKLQNVLNSYLKLTLETRY